MEEPKLREVSVSLSFIHYLALKGTSTALNKSLSRVVREAVHDLLEQEVWGDSAVYRQLLTEAGFFFRKSPRDVGELEETMDSRMHKLPPELIDRILDEIEKTLTGGEETPPIPIPRSKPRQRMSGNGEDATHVWN